MKLLIIIMIFWIPEVFSASFDCAKATTFIEHAICSEKELSDLDDSLMKSYQSALLEYSDKKLLKSEQKAWLINVRNKCNDISCLKRVYLKRITAIDTQKASLSETTLIKRFRLKYQDKAYIVPDNEVWRLSWSSPYRSGEVTPSYDVRVIGFCSLGDDNLTSIHAYSSEPDQEGLLDILSTSNDKNTIVWVYGGTKISIANELIKILAESYSTHSD